MFEPVKRIPLINFQDLQGNKDAVRELHALKRQLVSIAESVPIEMLASYAAGWAEDAGLDAGIQAVKRYFAELTEDIAKYDSQCGSAYAQWKSNLKPIFDRVVIRMFERKTEIERMKTLVKVARSSHEVKLKRLREAGLSADEALAMAGNGDVEIEVKQAELAAAQIEHDALERFTRSYNLGDLPDGFLSAA